MRGERTEQLSRHGRLPTWIAGIVFWASLLIGLALSFYQMRDLETRVHDRYAAELTALVNALSEAGRGETFDVSRLERLAARHGFRGIRIERDGRVLAEAGQPPIGSSHMRLDLPVGYRIIVVHPDIDEVVAAERKRILLTVGLVFSLFGFLLQWVLQRLLTRPFLEMVTAAGRFANGDERVRFDETRRDEFGYLGRFFNRALDYLMVQREELRTALARVRESEAALFQEKERAEVTLHSIGDAVITTDEAGCVDYLNPVAEQLTGYGLAEIRGRPLREVLRLVSELTREPISNPVDRCLQLGEIIELADNTLLVREDGTEVPIADSAAPIRDRRGEVIGAVMVFHDVGHARQLARELTYQATHDALTGLLNRREFERQLAEVTESARHSHETHALCYLDLDQFKVVNDTCGHLAGDELLRQLAELFDARVRETDLLARLGGDEFGILLRHCDLERARQVADELRQAVREFRFVYDEHVFEIGVSIGVVAIDGTAASMQEVFTAADVACYLAKDAGRNRVHIYHPEDAELRARQGEMRWVSRIQRAIDEDRFRLYAQPIVPLQQPEGELHYEVLMRILDEDGVEVPPMAFIPAAERYNLMGQVDRWVVDQVLEFIESRSGRFGDAVWAINLSGTSLGDDEFLEYLVERIRDLPVAGNLCFEITETAAIANLRRAVRFMKLLKSIGCRFALDDFGSGISSFAYLKNLEVDYLKIDGGFVRDMVEDPVDHAMVEAINRVGQVMSLKTIAEFVENRAIFQALRELGVDYAQGNGIAPAVPLETLGGHRDSTDMSRRLEAG